MIWCRTSSDPHSDWGNDIAEWIDEVTGMQSKIISFPHCQENFENGLEADFLYVVVSEKR